MCNRCRKRRGLPVYLPFTDGWIALCMRCRVARTLARMRELMA